LRALLRGLKEALRDPAQAVDSVLRRNNLAKRETELERFRMAIADNILTNEVRANGLGAVDLARLDRTIDQIALAYKFRTKPKASDIFDRSFLPPEADRRVE
jgi:NitT/TauT family transport system substrate-binding protein